MSKPEGTIHQLYTSFPIKDWKTMQACYHQDATFHDPVFQTLNYKEVKAMWHMLAAASADLKILFDEVKTKESTGSCRWQAWYKFSRTGRSVHNIIHAHFEFKEGKIHRHRDHFGLWRWSRMAFGPLGVILGWTPFFQAKIRKNARKSLVKFMADHPEYR